MNHLLCFMFIPKPSDMYEFTMQRFSLLGSTGSIGTQTLEIVAENPDRFEIVAMAAGSNIELLAQQVPISQCCSHSVEDLDLSVPL